MTDMMTPREYFGFEPGSDRHMIRYEDIIAYFRHMEDKSDRLTMKELGRTMEGGRPFMAAFISDTENLKELEELARISRRLSEPDLCSPEERGECIDRGRCFVMVSMSMHSNEVGGTQAAPLLAWDLITGEDEETRRIRRECVVILVPCGNPDGEIDFCDWYEKYLGTRYEGCCSPHLRHIYAGHSNNRDGVHVNLDETCFLNRLLMEYKPQAFLDHHHQSPWMERLTITPGTNPMSRECSPLQMRELEYYAQAMARDLARHRIRGVVTQDEFYDCWCYPIQQEIVRLQNIAGILAESADALIATPVYVPRETLGSHTIPCVECPDPWEGGWWHLSDIVNQMCLSTRALLAIMSRDRARVLEDMTLKGFEQIDRGRADPDGAYLIPRDQHDLSSLARLMRILKLQDIRCAELAEPYRKDRMCFAEGTIVVPLDQPYGGLVKMLLGKCLYPLDRYTKKADGTVRITDMATLNISDLMGVDVYAAGSGAELKTRPCGKITLPADLKANENGTYAEVNARLQREEKLFRDDRGDFHTDGTGRPVFLRRIGVLKMSCTANSEEGYTRLLFLRNHVPYRVVTDREIREGRFDDIDLLVIPGDTETALRATGEKPADGPEEYGHGLGESGFANLGRFVARGGRIVAWEASCLYAASAAGMPVINAAEGLDESRLNAHGSALRVVYEKCELTYGLPRESIVLYRNGPLPACPGWSRLSGRYKTFARFAGEDILADGMLIGGEYLAGRTCGMRIDCGNGGDVILTSFDPKFRNQTDVSFKVLFNALYRYGEE